MLNIEFNEVNKLKELPTKNKKMTNWLISSILVLALAATTILIIAKVNDSDSMEEQAQSKGSYIIAEEGLENFRTQLDSFTRTKYSETLERYNQLTPTDRSSFHVDELVTTYVQNYLMQQIGTPIHSDSYDKIDGAQPATSTTVEATLNPAEFTLKTTATIGADITTLKQIVRIDIDVPKTMMEGKYAVQYVAHANNKIVVQNASNVLGLLANKQPENISVDGSSCQHEFSGSAYINKCINDGNTSASNLKIINEQSFKNFLPTFPTKEIKAIEENDYNDEELYFKKEIPEEKKKAKIYYLKDSILTMDADTIETFEEDKPFSFNSSEERLKKLDIDGVAAYIDIGDGVQTLRIDQLNMTGNAHLHIIGSGDLKLFIKSVTSSEGQIFTDGAKISTYYDGDESLTLSKKFTSAGFIYSKKANLSLMMDTYDGNIISGGKKLSIIGGASLSPQLILLPKGTIELSNRTNFIGAMISKSLIVNQSTITFAKPAQSMEFPIQYALYGEVRQYLIFSKPTEL